MTLPFLLTLPWVFLLAFLRWGVRPPREIPGTPPARTPPVTVIVPARNEAVNIETVLTSVTASRYPDFEVVVVDDRSEDGTGALARAVPPGNARAIRVLDGEPLPPGWLGKPWACSQGASAARGELLLFTDADTVHGPDLLERAVAAMEEDRADLLSVSGRQLMGSFWERLVQPQIFFTMVMRFWNVEARVAKGSWRGAIANGQFMLFRREAYDAIGGHVAVRGEVVEDLVLAQLTVRSGRRLSVRFAETAFATRMYRSLPGLVEGWSKNLVRGGLATMPPLLRPFVAPSAAVVGAGLWLVPPVALAVALAGIGGTALLAWSGTVVAVSALLWTVFTVRMGGPAAYGLLYPLGAAAAMAIYLRSWARGTTVEWKGRRYEVEEVAGAP